MILLKYDTQHIRAFTYKEDFISFSHFEDDLLPIASILFSSASSLVVSSQILNSCHRLIFALQTKPFQIEISFDRVLTIIVDNKHFTMNEDRALFWKQEFQKTANKFSLYESLNVPFDGISLLDKFFTEIGWCISPYLRIYHVSYKENSFFIPFEWFYDRMIVIHSYCGNTYHNTQKIAIMYDPELELAYNESLKTLELLTLKKLEMDNKNPDVLFLSAHGTIKDNKSQLENLELQDIISTLNPKICVFNTCVLAQEISGLLQDFLDQGSVLIVSPFYTHANKTIFSPLLRFWSDDLFKTFLVAGIFHPRIARYFRYIN